LRFVAGIDIGSGTTKAVIMGSDRQVKGRFQTKTKVNFEAVALEVLEEALKAAGVDRDAVAYVATTGLGRYSISFRDIQITDITCGARGAAALCPDAECVLDVGSQSTRAIKLRDRGKVKEFHMNEKCAAGSGGFLERAAKYLEISIDQVGELSMESKTPQTISSVCAVLAETEIINHVSDGKTVPDIVRGLHQSLADRSLMQLKRVGMTRNVALIGGVAVQRGMVQACRERLGVEVIVPDHPQFVAAHGAALLGWGRLEKRDTVGRAADEQVHAAAGIR